MPQIFLYFQYSPQINGLQVETLFINHIQTNMAPKMRRRTYRAHGRINPYMSKPCHVELILSQRDSNVQAGESKDSSKALSTAKSGAGGFD